MISTISVCFQGGTPSPFDRFMGVRHGVRAFEYFVEQMEKSKDEFGMNFHEYPS